MKNTAASLLPIASIFAACLSPRGDMPPNIAKFPAWAGSAGQHLNGTDKGKDGFLSLDEFTAHAESKLTAIKKPKTTNH